jgi:hypothetical protein
MGKEKMKLFGGDESEHPMADAKDARKILDAVPGSDPFKAVEDLGHWLESVRTWETFKPEYRAQLVQMVDDATQIHLRKLQREYVNTPRLSKFLENRLWTVIREWHRQSALAFATCIDFYATGQKGSEVLKGSMPFLTVRALRALAAQMKWQSMRYAPTDAFLWGMLYKIYALSENRRFSRTPVAGSAGAPDETSAEKEFLKAVMLSASSLDSLLPAEIELVERLVARFVDSFRVSDEFRPENTYWADLASSQPPVRLVQATQRAATLRFFSASAAVSEVEQLMQTVISTNAVPSHLGLGGNYEADMVLRALNHLALYWSPKPPERKDPRHRVKSRVAVTHGFEGVLAALEKASLEEGGVESWIVENVSAGGFGASVPQVKGDWLRIGCLLALQPEGGTNWVVGVIRRFQRDAAQQGIAGIQTLARSAVTAKVKLQSPTARTGQEFETAILLNPGEAGSDAKVLLPGGVLLAGQNIEIERDGKRFLLLPEGIMERSEDYEIVRFRQMVREAGE